ncbi:2OG-Fe(II) oxygenase family protein [Urbifossiella limnaea]|uniref:hypothetical protein n=1 Tax=Urbifossiella limnaea TaxID=2528023 RepID=UPI0011AA16C3|nr:hypothetical protein [Urbifossiella limnaea]
MVHTHPHCFLSGVYHVAAEPDAGAPFFLDPRPAAVVMPPPLTAPNLWTFEKVPYPRGRAV